MSQSPHIYPFYRKDVAENNTKALAVPWDVAAWLLISVLLARAQFLGGIYPFGAAVLAAAAANYKKQLPLFFLALLGGSALAFGGSNLFVYGGIYLFLTLILFVYPVDLRKQWIVLPCLVAAVMMVGKGIAVFVGGVNTYLLMAAVFESLFAGGLTLAFLVVFQAVKRLDINPHFSVDETICSFVICAGIICGCAGWQIKGIIVQDVVSRLLILVAGYLGGAGAGAACGAMVGIVPSLSSVVAPTLIAVYAFSGMLAGLFSGFGKIGSVLGFFLGNFILAIYLLSDTQIAFSLLGGAASALGFLLIPHKAYRKLKGIFSATALKSMKEEKSERLLKLAVRRLKNAGWTFRELSKSLDEVADQKIDKEAGIKQVLEHLNKQICHECSMKEICWELDYAQTYRGVLRLFAAVEKKGSAGIRDVPENFSRRCPHIKELLAASNCLYELFCRSNYWQVQRQSSRNLLSSQMAAMADVLMNVAGEITDFSRERELLDREMKDVLNKGGLAAAGAGVSSISGKSIDIWVDYDHCPGEQICREHLQSEVSRLLGSSYRVHECSCGAGNNRCDFRLLADGARQVLIGKAQLAKDEQGICGDCGEALLLEEGRQLLMVSDGMGVGQKAARESSAALSLVSRLLSVGVDRDTAIETVNAAMSLRAEDESFVTLDLCILDLYEGDAEFIKTGGSPSFIKRGAEVKTVNGKGLPVGFLNDVEQDVIEEKTQAGDLIVMASDGFAEAVGDGGRLTSLLQQAPAEDAQKTAEYLLERAVSLSGGAIRDDITILVAKIA